MDDRAAKLALARKKLRDHQEKKQQEYTTQPNQHSPVTEIESIQPQLNETTNFIQPLTTTTVNDGNLNNNTSELIPVDKVVKNIHDNNVNVTEILVESKRILELQVNTLQTKIIDLEDAVTLCRQNYNNSCQKNSQLENELKNLNYEHRTATEQLKLKDAAISELNDLKSLILNEKSSLQEQLEFTKSVLTAKEAENGSLHSQLFNVQSQLDATQLQLQQLSTGANSQLSSDNTASLKHENEVLIQKVSHLEQQLKIHMNDYQQLNNHYEHYVAELSDQMKLVVNKNEQLTREIQDLSNRENSLVEQISEMEIRIQNYKLYENFAKEQKNVMDTSAFDEVQRNYEKAKCDLQELSSKYADLQQLYCESQAEVEKLTHSKELETSEPSDNISLIKLSADITSDKIAAQRATEQNKKLKEDIHGLEDAFVKMTKDKLELTEKISAEKFLNRELTIKLAEIDEKSNDLQKTLKAKDEEMIRLQTSYRIIEEKYNEMAEHFKHLSGIPDTQETAGNGHIDVNNIKDEVDTLLTPTPTECPRHGSSEYINNNEGTVIPKGDAMVKLQERFLKIMDEVADLSDEKHRLEHIITQLQNETDTICEYVALYQQQRCLLKKRDEERTAQIIMFQSECTRLQSQLDELTAILTRFAEDKQLSSYFQTEGKHEEIQKVMRLLAKLKTNSLIDPEKSMKFNDFYPCSCCSGQLIEV